MDFKKDIQTKSLPKQLRLWPIIGKNLGTKLNMNNKLESTKKTTKKKGLIMKPNLAKLLKIRK